ncbi:hypothetical protein RchiOBHm_Chr2g0168401 [Rosa chinensis]|uniref:Uncharacterized protein n=1 Tax=Rosa chinensis TaxID=74649 RepID=A0A2P6S4K9_ROSCH|nr:hypothetical protein RchiOBHm_Chr2g0168401 [Rosa chinensis]
MCLPNFSSDFQIYSQTSHPPPSQTPHPLIFIRLFSFSTTPSSLSTLGVLTWICSLNFTPDDCSSTDKPPQRVNIARPVVL